MSVWSVVGATHPDTSGLGVQGRGVLRLGPGKAALPPGQMPYRERNDANGRRCRLTSKRQRASIHITEQSVIPPILRPKDSPLTPNSLWRSLGFFVCLGGNEWVYSTSQSSPVTARDPGGTKARIVVAIGYRATTASDRCPLLNTGMTEVTGLRSGVTSGR